MRKIRIIFASALLAGGIGTLGCGAEAPDDNAYSEPTGTNVEEIGLLTASFNPSSCTQSATQCNFGMNMHCCPPGQAMTGVNLGENTFQCRPIVGEPQVEVAGDCWVEAQRTRSIDGVNIRACSPDRYMRGLHAGNNALTCCRYPAFNSPMSEMLAGDNEPRAQALAPWIDSPWPWAGVCKPGYVHVCPNNASGVQGVMSGFSTGNNWLLCAW